MACSTVSDMDGNKNDAIAIGLWIGLCDVDFVFVCSCKQISILKSFCFSSLVSRPMVQRKGKSKAKAKKANSVSTPKLAPKKSSSGKASTASTAHQADARSSRLTTIEPTQDQNQGPDATQDLPNSEQNDNPPSVCILTFSVFKFVV
jgi:hypothetical protein